MFKQLFSRFSGRKNLDAEGNKPAPPRDMMKEVMSADTDLYVHVRPTHYNPDILAQRKGGLRIYEKMRRDDAITACLGLKKHAVLSSGWSIESASDDPKDVEVAEFIEDNFKKMSGVFDDILLEIMTAFEYGFSVTEKVLKVDSWKKYQNRIMLKTLKTRKPHGIDFDADIHGNLLDDGIIQAKNDRFPAKKFIIYVNKQEFGNWYGESDLRNCYRAWWSKDNIIKFWNIFLERYGMPPAIGKIEGELQNESSDMAAIQNILKTLQSASSVILPDNISLDFPNTNNGQASKSYDEAISMHDMAIARSLLVPSLLGLSTQGAHGSYSQAKTQFDVFLFIILKIRRGLEELISEQLVRELVDYNYSVEDYPVFKFLPLEDDTKMELAKMFLEAVKIDVLTPDQDDKNLLRKLLGWPEKEESELEPIIEPPTESPSESSPTGDVPKEELSPEDIAEGKEEKEKEEKKLEQKDYAFIPPRPLTRFEKKVNFARVDKELTELETDSRDRLIDVLLKQRDHILDFLGKRLEAGTVTMKLINSLQLKFGREIQQTLREMLREAHTLGRDSSAAEVQSKRYQKLPPVHAIEWFSQQSFQIKGVIDGSISNSVKNLLIQGLESGESTKETMQKISRAYTPYVGTREKIADEDVIRPYRTETLVRTNMMGAYNHGRIAMSFEEEVKDYIKGWQYSAILDDRTTDICIKLDGRIFRKGDPRLGRFIPPNHFNCFIDSQVPIYTSKGWVSIGDINIGDLVLTHMGRFRPVTFVHHKQKPTKYDGDVIKITIKTRKRNKIGYNKTSLTVTPDHPILLDNKWVLAKDVVIGDKLTVSGVLCKECGKLIPWLRRYGSKKPKYCSSQCIAKGNGICNWSDDRRKKQSKLTTQQLNREYSEEIRNRYEITKEAVKKIKELCKKGIFVLQMKGVRKLAHKARNESNKFRKAITIDRMGNKNVMKRPKVRLKASNTKKQYYLNNPEKHPNRIMAKATMNGNGGGYISKPQMKLFETVRKLFSEVELEYPVKIENKLYFLDVCIPKYKLNFEYDGSYWHSTEEAKQRDKNRDTLLFKDGWTVIRYKDTVPTEHEIDNEVNRILMNHNKEYHFTDVGVVSVEHLELKKPRRLYNFSVLDDESYIAKGFVVHNCRSMLVPVTEDEEPFESISTKAQDEALQFIPEQFGGTVGRPAIAKRPIDVVAKRKKIEELSTGFRSKGEKTNSYHERIDKMSDDLKNKTKDWISKLKTREKNSIIDYADEFEYKNINGALRGKIKPTGKIQKHIDNLDSAFSNVSMPEDTVVYRRFGTKTTERLMNLKSGEMFVDDGFGSTSLINSWQGKPDKVYAEILVPKGAKAAYIQPLSKFPREFELLLDRGSKFKIIGTRTVQDTTFLQMEVVVI